MKKKLSLILAIFTVSPLLAHSVWIEPDSQGHLVVRFAEPDGKFEKSPGHLDELILPTAWTSTNDRPAPLAVEKKHDHFLIVNSAPANSVQIETRFEVMAAPGRPGRLPFFYARWAPNLSQPGSPALTLDLVPTGEPGTVRVFFRGQPLAGIAATLRTPDEKEQTLAADAGGMLHFSSSQSGLHLLTLAHHRETLAGFAEGRSYDLTSHNAALTWVQP